MPAPNRCVDTLHNSEQQRVPQENHHNLDFELSSCPHEPFVEGRLGRRASRLVPEASPDKEEDSVLPVTSSSTSPLSSRPTLRLPFKMFRPALRLDEEDAEYGQPRWERTSWMRPVGQFHPFVRLAAAVLLYVAGILMMKDIVKHFSRDTEQAVQDVLPDPVAVEPYTPFEEQPVFESIQSVIEDYLQAVTFDELLCCVRDQDRVKGLMKRYYANHEMVPDQLSEVTFVARKVLGDREFYVAQAETMLGNDEKFVLFEEAGRVVVDWETKVGYNPFTWEQLTDLRPQDPQLLRVYAVIGDYYNYEYADRREYMCVELRSPHSDAILYGYVDRNSESCFNLRWHLRSGNEMPLMVEVAFEPESTSSNQVRIKRLTNGTWLTLETS